MTRSSTLIAAMVLALLLAGCGSSGHIISTTDGTMIATQGEPKLDDDSGMYSYELAEGRAASISKKKVKQIMEC
jgi:major membrane immunogen (membrane-anchored lipoprotein)